VGQGGIGWKHQYMMGTMHSAVLTRDVRKVTSLLDRCLAGDLEYADMETQDDEGYTPLHYACLLRLTNITRVLHESNADVTIPDSRGLTAIHWAALQLDSAALEMLCSHVFNVDITDDKDRTPLYLACVEGRDVQGHTDIASLNKCVACLMRAGANPNLRDKEGLTVLHYLSASWQYQVIETMITSVNALTTMAPGTHVVNLNTPDMDGWSALHFACSGNSLKRVLGEGHRIIQSHAEASRGASSLLDVSNTASEPTRLEDSIGTLRVLLRNGVFPNMRDYKGRRAIDVMASNMSRWTGNLQPSLLLLMAHGTRVDEGIPEELRTSDASIVFEEGVAMWAKVPLINGDDMGLR
jgi:ankyrin repeat protein